MANLLRGLLDLNDEDKAGALNMGLLQAGLGILANNTQANPMPAIGQGGLQGLQGYQQALDRAQKQKLLAIEKQKLLRELQQQQAIDAFQQKVASGAYTVSPEQQALAGGGGPTVANAAKIAGFKPTMDRASLYKDMIGTPGMLAPGLSGMQTMEENALKREEHKALLEMKQIEAKIARGEKLTAQELQQARELLSEERIAQGRNDTLLAVAQMRADASQARARNTPSLNGQPLTEGQKATDRKFGREYADYQAGGGSADVEKQLGQLDRVASELSIKGNDYTGPAVGLLPDKVRAFTNQKAVDAKNAVEEVAQRNLRLVLGAQFTKEEGERLIARAYNPSLDPAINARRVKALANQIRTAAAVKEDAAKYFEQNGTLAGWTGRMPTLSDIESAIDSVGSNSAKGQIQGRVVGDLQSAAREELARRQRK